LLSKSVPGFIDTTGISTDPQQTRLHPGVTPIFNQMELDNILIDPNQSDF
jgi:hypothetical protein